MKNRMNSVLVLNGSPRIDGNTDQLADYFLYLIGSDDVRYIRAYELNINPCTDCGLCKKIKGCRYNDMDFIDKALRECDIVLIASPVYNYSFPAPLKAIFDRMQRYFSERFTMKNDKLIGKHKKVVLITVCGSNDISGTEIMKKQIRMISNTINSELIGTISLTGTDKRIDDKIYDSVKGEIKQIVNLI